MKNILDLKKKRTRVEKPKYNFKKAPTPIPKAHNPYENISRIMPFYVADNYSYFEVLTPPKQKIKDWDSYILRIKQKISCLKAQFLL